jgi:intracellular septation protein
MVVKISNFPHDLLRKVFIGSFLEFGPILLFLLSYHFFHIYKATFILMIMTIISTIVTYRLQKRLPYVALYVALLTTIFGYMTIAHHQPKFIQIRDTMYDITLALTLLTGVIIDFSFLKLAFQSILPMNVGAWRKLTYSWIVFFIVGAILNEYVRRVMDLHQWFEFKMTMIFVTIIFGCVTLYFFYEKGEHHSK